MTAVHTEDLTRAARLAALFSGVVALTALTVHLAAADDARHVLGFTFPGLPRELGEAGDIFLSNLRLLAAALVASLVVSGTRITPDMHWIERAGMRWVNGVCDVVLLLGWAFHVVFVGSALGAYGHRLFDSLFPHAPVELAAFSLALALYVAARRGPVDAKRFIGVGLLAVGVLALAAVLEVYG